MKKLIGILLLLALVFGLLFSRSFIGDLISKNDEEVVDPPQLIITIGALLIGAAAFSAFSVCLATAKKPESEDSAAANPDETGSKHAP